MDKQNDDECKWINKMWCACAHTQTHTGICTKKYYSFIRGIKFWYILYMDEPREHYARQNKSYTKVQKLYGSIYRKYIE